MSKFDQIEVSGQSFPTERSREERALDITFVDDYLNKQHPRPSLDEFKGVYPPEEIAADKRFVEEREAEIKRRDQKRVAEGNIGLESVNRFSSALEAVVIDQADKSLWLGESTMITRASRFDDLHGIDAVAEFTDAGDNIIAHAALSIDATRNADYRVMSEKVDRNVERLLGQDPQGSVKYFASQRTSFKGGLKNVIPVIVGADRDTAEELLFLFARYVRLEQNKTRTPRLQEQFKDVKAKIEQHPIQLLFLEEIAMQLRAYDEILSSLPSEHPSKHFGAEVTALRALIDETIGLKKEAGISPSQLTSQDGTQRSLGEALESAISRHRPVK